MTSDCDFSYGYGSSKAPHLSGWISNGIFDGGWCKGSGDWVITTCMEEPLGLDRLSSIAHLKKSWSLTQGESKGEAAEQLLCWEKNRGAFFSDCKIRWQHKQDGALTTCVFSASHCIPSGVGGSFRSSSNHTEQWWKNPSGHPTASHLSRDLSSGFYVSYRLLVFLSPFSARASQQRPSPTPCAQVWHELLKAPAGMFGCRRWGDTENAGSNADSSYAAVNLLISVVSLKAYSHGRVEIMVYVVFSAFAPYLLWKSHKTQREDMRNLPGEQ